MNLKRGDIYLVSLDPTKGSEQGKSRPAVVIQNDIGNKFSPTTIIAPITSSIGDRLYPHEVFITSKESGLNKDGVILLNQVRCVDKLRMIKKLGSVPKNRIDDLNRSLAISLGLVEF